MLKGAKKLFFDPDPDHDLGYVRSKIMGIFVFFDVSSKDAATITTALDTVDKDYTGIINVSNFCKIYLPEYGDVFQWIFGLFYEVMCPPDPNASIHEEHVELDDNSSQFSMDGPQNFSNIASATINGYNAAGERVLAPKSHPEYFHFIGFLIFIMHLQQDDLSLVLFWLGFYLPKQTVDKTTLLQYLETVWNKNSFDKVRRKSTKKFKAYADKSLKQIRAYDDFNAFKFQSYDILTGRAWSKPLIEMRDELRDNLGGKILWSRVSKQVLSTITSDVDVSLTRMDDIKKKLWQTNGLPPLDDKGERKESRRELRRFIRCFKSYLEMPVVDESGMGGIGKSTVLGLLMSYANITTLNPFAGLIKKKKEGDENNDKENTDGKSKLSSLTLKKAPLPIKKDYRSWFVVPYEDPTEIKMPLELKFKKHLKMDLPIMYAKCKDAKELAKAKLGMCGDVIPLSAFEKSLPKISINGKADEVQDELEDDEGTHDGYEGKDGDDEDEDEEGTYDDDGDVSYQHDEIREDDVEEENLEDDDDSTIKPK